MNLDEITVETLETDPYPIYQYLRENRPIAQMPGMDNIWLATTWDACSQIAEQQGLAGGHPGQEEFFEGPNILTMEGKAHTELRAGIDAPLRPKHVKQYMDDLANQIIAEYVARIKPKGKADLVAELFEPISVRIVGTHLGLGELDDATLMRWFKALSAGLQHHSVEDAATLAKANASKKEIDDYLRIKIKKLQTEPDHSLLSHMIHTGLSEGAQPRTFDDIMPSVRVIILGGFQEPGTALSNTFLGLLTNPAQYAQLVADPVKLAPIALNEGLRWITPIGTVERTLTEPITIGAVEMPAGALVTLVMSSANRDETRFANADNYDLNRELQSATVFGYGSHYCAGNFLAKNICIAAITEVAKSLPGLSLAANAKPKVSGHFFHSVDSLLAEWNA